MCKFVYQIEPNPCQHYYWEYEPNNYIDFLFKNGHISRAFSNVESAGVIDSEEIEEEEDFGARMQSMVDSEVMVDVVKKTDELIFLCRSFFSAFVLLIAIMVYVVGKR